MPNTNRPTISTHVLDPTGGKPAAGVAVTLWRLEGNQHVSQGTSETDADGRIAQLEDGQITAGTYRLSFEVGAYYKRKGTTAFLQRATLDFEITDPRSEEHTSELQSQSNLVCRLLLEKKKHYQPSHYILLTHT